MDDVDSDGLTLLHPTSKRVYKAKGRPPRTSTKRTCRETTRKRKLAPSKIPAPKRKRIPKVPNWW